MNILNKLQKGLKKTSSLITNSILNAVKSNKVSDELIEEIETALISSDISLQVNEYLISQIKKTKIKDEVNSLNILKLLEKEITKILENCEKNIFQDNITKPTILLFIGVNGSGKTTTIGKLIKKIGSDKKILVAACDTFRAAAVEQLSEWVNYQNADLFKGTLNQDPASVAYNAVEKAKIEKYDYLIIDTAGRLSNNTNLLNQLIKIKSVINKSSDDLNKKTILVLDGTNGSNMINQAEIFDKSLEVSGIIITKLDGTAKGGALISIAKKYEMPIYFIGLGEKDSDLIEFNANQFAKSILNTYI